MNEAELVERLERHGLSIIFPEQLSFADQVRLFAEREMIVGSVGSGFHTSHVLSRPGQDDLPEQPRLHQL